MKITATGTMPPKLLILSFHEKVSPGGARAGFSVALIITYREIIPVRTKPGIIPAKNSLT